MYKGEWLTLVDLLQDEINNIKKHATKEELACLDHTKHSAHGHLGHQIYWMLSGFNYKRYYELRKLCAPKVYLSIPKEQFDKMKNHEFMFNQRVAGRPSMYDSKKYETPLEVYEYVNHWFNCHHNFVECKKNNKQIIDYLKGETKNMPKACFKWFSGARHSALSNISASKTEALQEKRWKAEKNKNKFNLKKEVEKYTRLKKEPSLSSPPKQSEVNRWSSVVCHNTLVEINKSIKNGKTSTEILNERNKQLGKDYKFSTMKGMIKNLKQFA